LKLLTQTTLNLALIDKVEATEVTHPSLMGRAAFLATLSCEFSGDAIGTLLRRNSTPARSSNLLEPILAHGSETSARLPVFVERCFLIHLPLPLLTLSVFGLPIIPDCGQKVMNIDRICSSQSQTATNC
jgi:hypothetical protein